MRLVPHVHAFDPALRCACGMRVSTPHAAREAVLHSRSNAGLALLGWLAGLCVLAAVLLT